MNRKNLLNLLGLDLNDKPRLNAFLKASGLSLKDLRYFSDNNILPNSQALNSISNLSGLSVVEIQIGMGIVTPDILAVLMEHSKDVATWASKEAKPKSKIGTYRQVYNTELGVLHEGDCMSLLKATPDESFDLIFADPPFNLNKQYLSNFDDNQSSMEYLDWCFAWIEECIRCLKKGGSLFIWNLPKWNGRIATFLSERLTFRHWIATDIKQSLPIQGKLYPAHYSLLYFVKGEKPNVYHADRLPMEVCRHCMRETKDYGGYKDKMNPTGINLTDIWLDIPPVRHAKYKKRTEANELSIKLMDRIIEMASNEGDTVFDPFGGSGTSYAVAEIKKRKWVGIELGPTDQIVDRLQNIGSEDSYLADIRSNYNQLFSPAVKNKRKKLGIWTDDTFADIDKQTQD